MENGIYPTIIVPRLKRTFNAVSHFYVMPNSRIRLFMDFVTTSVVLYNAFTVSYRSGFEYYTPWPFLILDIFADTCMLVNLLLQFFEPAEVGNDIIKDRRVSLRKNLIGLGIEFISIFPLDYLSHIWGSHPAYRLNRLISLLRIGKYYSSIENKVNINPIVLRMAKAFFSLSLVTHWFTCVWFWLAVYQPGKGHFMFTEPPDDSIWEHLTPVPNEVAAYSLPRITQYMVGLANITMYIVGYAALLPSTYLEAIFGLIAIIIGSGLFVAIVGTVSSLLDNMDQTNSRFKKKIDELKQYMKFRRISPQLQRDIREFYNTLQFSKRSSSDEADILGDLDLSIKRELYKYLHRELVGKVPLFSQCGDMFVDDICVHLKHTLLLKDYYIVRKGEIGKEMFFIGSGSVEVVSEDGSIIYAILSKGKFFGEIALISDDPKRTASIRAAELCELYILYKKDFDSVLSKYPSARQKIKSEAEKRKSEIEKKKKELNDVKRRAVSKISIVNKMRLLTQKPDEKSLPHSSNHISLHPPPQSSLSSVIIHPSPYPSSSIPNLVLPLSTIHHDQRNSSSHMSEDMQPYPLTSLSSSPLSASSTSLSSLPLILSSKSDHHYHQKMSTPHQSARQDQRLEPGGVIHIHDTKNLDDDDTHKRKQD